MFFKESITKNEKYQRIVFVQFAIQKTSLETYNNFSEH